MNRKTKIHLTKEDYMKSETKEKRFYILVGDEQNWQVALKEKMWGFSENVKGSWNTIQNNEIVAFYVTKPIQKIIGFGIVREKFIGDNIIWSDEKLVERPFFKYRIRFDIIDLITNWKKGISLPENTHIQGSRRVISSDLFLKLVKKADSNWKSKIYQKIISFQKAIIS